MSQLKLDIGSRFSSRHKVAQKHHSLNTLSIWVSQVFFTELKAVNFEASSQFKGKILVARPFIANSRESK
jgi:hypothetical protein